jgi:hypothetical protein
MRFLLICLLAGSLGIASALLVACGDRNDLIPKSNADAIKSQVDSVEAAAAARRCEQAKRAVLRAQQEGERLPDDVDRELRANVDDALARLGAVVQRTCTQTTPTQTTTQETFTTPPETTRETTQAPTTDTGTTETGTTEERRPPDQGQGQRPSEGRPPGPDGDAE